MTMLRTQAWERLNDPEYSGQLTMGQLYSLMVEAGYPKNVAHNTALQRGWDRLDANLSM